jgi:protein-tyrosine phosphatase
MPAREIPTQPSRVALVGAPNFRDLGGYRTTDGRAVRTGTLFRSGHLAHLTDGDLDLLGRIGIATVVDFRPDREVEMFGPDRLRDGTTYVSIPIGDGAHTPAAYEAVQAGDFTGLHDLAEASRTMIRENATEFRDLIHLIAEKDNLPLVFHCIGGKDRTGVASALILSILGIPWPTVRADYLLSNKMMQGVVEEQISRLSAGKLSAVEPTAQNLAALRRFFVLKGSYIDAAREESERLAGSFPNYVAQCIELSPGDIASLRANLLLPG